MKARVAKFKQELTEFIEAAKAIKGHWQVWPTLWAGGTSSVQVDGVNTIWVDSDKGGEVCRFRTDHNRRVTEDMYTRARFIARARNISPAMAECLLELVKYTELEESAANGRALERALAIWEAAK